MALRPSSDDISEEPFTDPFTDTDDYSTILDDDISYDFLSFLAIAQSVNAEFIDMTMHPGLGLAGRGATADIDQALLNRSVALAYKRHVKVGTSPELAFKALATEVLVLQQPRIWQHENIIDLFGIGWDIKVNKEKEVEQILPVLVLENASIFGTLEMFMKDEAAQLQDVVADVEDDPSLVLPDFDYGDCIRICRGIGRALQILHAYNMIHGDLKPSNVVIFPDDLHRFTPKLIDFGFTTFGLSDQELVQLAGTQGWRAPEWHHRFFKIEDAKKQDIYSYGKVCWWVLKECPAVPYLATNSNLDAFFKLSLETNPALRPAEVGVLLDLVDSAYRDERWSRIHNFGNNTRMTDSLKSWLRNLLLSQPRYAEINRHGELIGDPHVNIFGPPPEPIAKKLPKIPDLSLDFNRFSASDYFLRRWVFQCLCAKTHSMKQTSDFYEASFQLAFCYEIAFGTPRDTELSRGWLKASAMTELHLTEFVQKSISSEAKSGSQLIATVKWTVRSELAKGYLDLGLIEHTIKAHQYEIEGKNQCGGSQLLATQALQLQLSHLLSASGGAKAAIELLHELLHTSTELWGEESNPVIECRASLGIILAEQGHWEQSIKTDEQTLTIMSKILDDNDPRRLQIMYGLSYRLARYGKAQEAEELQRQLLNTCTRILGSNHPDTVLATEILAYTICAKGKYEEAERLQNTVLKVRRRVLGEDSDITVLAMINLSSVLSRLPGKIDEATELQQEASKKTVQSYGEAHPFSIEQMDGLASRQEQGGLIQEAIMTRRQIFQIRTDQRNGPQILAAMGNHAKLLISQGQLVEAEILIAEVIEQASQYVQKDKQLSELAVKGLANAFLGIEGFDEASEAIYARCLALYKTRLEAFGGEHPNTRAVASILGALQGHGRVVQTCIRVLGLDHITTQNALNRLVNWLVGLQALDTESLKLRSEVLDLVGVRTALSFTKR